MSALHGSLAEQLGSVFSVVNPESHEIGEVVDAGVNKPVVKKSASKNKKLVDVKPAKKGAGQRLTAPQYGK